MKAMIRVAEVYDLGVYKIKHSEYSVNKSVDTVI